MSVGQRVHDSIPRCDENLSTTAFIKKVPSTFKFKRITEMSVVKIVEKMPAKTSKGPDGISNFLLKELINVIKEPLTTIFNKSLSAGIFPDLMKLARVIPLFKNGEPSNVDNYRPISLLPVISKVLEWIVYQQLTLYLENNGILYPKQFGFRKGHSTSDAVVNLIGDTLRAIDNGLMVLSVFIDLQKAFDTVSYQKVWEKLALMGVCDTEMNWIKSYMTGRSQYMDVNGVSLSTKGLSIGVAQGSLLGVLIFQLFINDLPKSLRYSMSILYADDTTIYLVGRSWKCMIAKMQNDLNNLSKWLSVNNLKLNVKKTKVLLFSSEGISPNPHLEIYGHELDVVESFKFLGLWVDNNLSFSTHFTNVYNKLLKATFIIRSLAKVLPRYVLRTLYYAYYYSHLSYCVLLWYPMLTMTAKNAIYVLQKRLIRTLTNAHFRDHCMPLFKSMKTLTVNDLVYKENVLFVQRIVNAEAPLPVINLFDHATSTTLTRNRNIIIPKHKLALVNRSFLCKSVSDWLSVLVSTKLNITRNGLSRKLVTDLCNKY